MSARERQMNPDITALNTSHARCDHEMCPLVWLPRSRPFAGSAASMPRILEQALHAVRS